MGWNAIPPPIFLTNDCKRILYQHLPFSVLNPDNFLSKFDGDSLLWKQYMMSQIA